MTNVCGKFNWKQLATVIIATAYITVKHGSFNCICEVAPPNPNDHCSYSVLNLLIPLSALTAQHHATSPVSYNGLPTLSRVDACDLHRQRCCTLKAEHLYLCLHKTIGDRAFPLPLRESGTCYHRRTPLIAVTMSHVTYNYIHVEMCKFLLHRDVDGGPQVGCEWLLFGGFYVFNCITCLCNLLPHWRVYEITIRSNSVLFHLGKKNLAQKSSL